MSTEAQTAPHPPAVPDLWRAYLPLALTVLALGGLYWTTLYSMVEIWINSPTFAHGFAVPVIAGWLAWERREKLARLAPRPLLWMLAPLAVMGLLWLLGVFGEVNAMAQFGAVAMLVLLVPCLAGVGVTRQLIFPLGFLLAFSVPIGEFLMPQLMQSTADFTVAALNLTGIPVFREGQQLVIPSGRWSVVEACSGIRYLIASLMVGTLYAYLNYYTLRRRIAFVIFSALVPLVANWLRAYMVVMIGHLSSNKLATGVDHIIYGWVFFGIVMALMFWVGSFWYETEIPEETPLAADAAPPMKPALIWAAALATLLVLAAPRLLEAGLQARQTAAGMAHLQPLADLPGWEMSKGGLTTWAPQYRGAADELHQSYRRDGRLAGLYVAYYRNQSRDNKLVSSANFLAPVDGAQWLRVGSEIRDVRIGKESLSVMATELRTPGVEDRLLAWHWYWIGGHLTSSEYMAKAYTALIRLLGKGDDSALVVIYTPQGAAKDESAFLQRFMDDALPRIENALSASARLRSSGSDSPQ